MPDWTVEVELYVPRKNIRVKGADYTEVMCTAQERADEMAKKMHPEATAHVRILRQHGEPWVRFYMSGGWYDLNDSGSDVIVMDRSTGNAFDAADIKLLKGRLQRVLGVKIVEHWNGEGCNQVSFRARGRGDAEEMTKEQREKITAPRKGKTDA